MKRAATYKVAWRVLTALAAVNGSCERGASPRDVVIESTSPFGSSDQAHDQALTIRHLVVDETGRVFVLDDASSSIMVFTGGGEFLRSIGRRGSGPGELLRANTFAVSHDTLVVVNTANGRLDRFGVDGQYLYGVPLPGAALAGSSSVLPTGELLVATRGRGDALGERFRPGRLEPTRVGHPRALWRASASFDVLKREVMQGKTPPEFLNSAIPVLGSDGRAWLALGATAAIEAVSSRDSLLWQSQLDLPELKFIQERFRRRNALETNPTRIHALTVFSSAAPVGDRLWLHIISPDTTAAHLLVVAADGRLSQRIVVLNAPLTDDFAIDSARSLLYLGADRGTRIVVAKLPRGTVQ